MNGSNGWRDLVRKINGWNLDREGAGKCARLRVERERERVCVFGLGGERECVWG